MFLPTGLLVLTFVPLHILHSSQSAIFKCKLHPTVLLSKIFQLLSAVFKIKFKIFTMVDKTLYDPASISQIFNILFSYLHECLLIFYVFPEKYFYEFMYRIS